MPNPVIVGAGLSLGSSMAQSSAAKKAAKEQSAAADAQIAESRRQFDTVRGLLSPYVNGGNAAGSQLFALLGLGGMSQVNGTLPEITTIQAATPTPRPQPTGFGAVQARPGFGYGTRMDDRRQARKNRGAVQSTAPATQYQVNGQIFNSLEEAQAFAEANRTYSTDPNAAAQAQQQAIGAIKNGSQFKELNRQGQDAILANASATGGLRGGNTQAALAQFSPNLLQSLIDKQIANLGGIYSTGANAAAGLGTAAQNTGAQVSQALGDKGSAQAGGYLAAGQATSNLFGDIAGGIGNFVGRQGIPSGATLFGSWGF